MPFFSIPTKAAVVAGLSAAAILGTPALAAAIPPPAPPTGSGIDLPGFATGSTNQGTGPFAEYSPVAGQVLDLGITPENVPTDVELSLGN